MAGQKIYNTLVQTTGKGPVIVTASMNVNTANSTSNSAAIINGKQVGVSGSAGVVTVTFPEKYGKCEWLDASLVDTGKTGNQPVVTTDYNPATGTCVFSILSPTQTAVTTGTFKMYISALFVLGM